MRIHHFTIPAREPARVAAVLAELLGARVVPLPHPEGTLLVTDADGTAIEVWPAATRVDEEAHQLALRPELPLPDAWPHHAYVTSEACDSEQILAVFAREGWFAEKARNGSPEAGFSLVRGRIENMTQIELGGSDMRAEYEQFFVRAMQRARGAA